LAPKPVQPRPLPRLYLATPPVDDPQALLGVLADLLKAADIAAVLLRKDPTSALFRALDRETRELFPDP